MSEEPNKPEDVAAIAKVAELLWQLDKANRPDVVRNYSEAQDAGTTSRYEKVATELWRRGWLDLVAIISDAGGRDSA